MNEKQQQLITIARSWLGTPWRHNQCVKGLGVDCVNFVWAVAKEAGLDGSDLPSRYARVSCYRQIEKYLDGFLPRIEVLRESNLLLFELNGYTTHIGFATDKGMIHASLQWGEVVEHPIDGIWANSLVKQWKVF